MEKNKEYFGELLLIIGGFILAETIIKQFLDMSQGNLSWWVLPLIALVMISGAIELKKGRKLSGYEIIYWSWLIVSIILIVFVRTDILSSINFLWIMLIISIIQIISFFISLFSRLK